MNGRPQTVRARCAAAALALATGSTCALGQGMDPPPRAWLQVQALSASVKSDAAFDGVLNSRQGDRAALESELGLPDSVTTAGLALGVRVAQAWRVEASLLRLRRKGTATLTRDVGLGDARFEQGTSLASDVNLSTLRANAGWLLLGTPQSEVGLVLGARGISLDAHFTGTGRDPNDPSISVTDTRSSDVSLAVVLGGFASHAISPAWKLDGRLDFALGGSLVEAQAGVSWWPNRAVSLGLGYRLLDARIDSLWVFISGSSRIQTNFRVHGPQLVVQGAF
jgi:hypothetical protein